MNLYLVSQSERRGWDTFDAFVCAAENEHEARNMHPCDSYYEDEDKASKWNDGAWASSPENVQVAWIGKAGTGTNAGIILASFHAG